LAFTTSQMLKLLDRHDPTAAQYLSAFSVALTRVAMADDTMDDTEREVIREALNSSPDLQSAEVDLVMELAHTGSLP
jgi:tellurite resistance protein